MEKTEEFYDKIEELSKVNETLRSQIDENNKTIDKLTKKFEYEKNKDKIGKVNSLLGKYIKTVHTFETCTVYRYIKVKEIQTQECNEWMLLGKTVALVYNGEELITYTYDKEAKYLINFEWSDVQNCYFKIEDIEESSEEQFNLALELFKTMI